MAYTQDINGNGDSFVALINPATGKTLANRDIITTEISNNSQNAVVAEFGAGHILVADNDVTAGDVAGEDLLVIRTSNGDTFSNNTFTGITSSMSSRAAISRTRSAAAAAMTASSASAGLTRFPERW